jgi:hypothetical protein
MHSLFTQIGALQLLGGLVLFLRTKLPLTVPEPGSELQACRGDQPGDLAAATISR